MLHSIRQNTVFVMVFIASKTMQPSNYSSLMIRRNRYLIPMSTYRWKIIRYKFLSFIHTGQPQSLLPLIIVSKRETVFQLRFFFLKEKHYLIPTATLMKAKHSLKICLYKPWLLIPPI